MPTPTSARVLTVEPGETVAATLRRLRTESFDAVVAMHGPSYDALVLARALRGAGDETPVAIHGVAGATAREVGADFGWRDGEPAPNLAALIAARIAQREARRALAVEQRLLGEEHVVAGRLVDRQHEQLASLRDVAGPDVRRYLAAEPPASETPARAA